MMLYKTKYYTEITICDGSVFLIKEKLFLENLPSVPTKYREVELNDRPNAVYPMSKISDLTLDNPKKQISYIRRIV